MKNKCEAELKIKVKIAKTLKDDKKDYLSVSRSLPAPVVTLPKKKSIFE